MKAIQISQVVSGPEELKVTTFPTPGPHPDKYLIKIRACGANFFDILQIQGKYQHQPALPWLAGMEFAGVVIATPTSSKSTSGTVASSLDGTVNTRTSHQFKVGDRVFGASQGAYATHILAAEESIFPVPEGWSFADASGVHVTTPTAYGALVTRAKTQPGEWVLVHAGAGGVGLSAVQVAKALGATVIATAGTARKRQVCLDFGADYVVDYRQKDWPQQIIALCEKHRTGNGKAGVDVVYDPVGKSDLIFIRLARREPNKYHRHDRPLDEMYSMERPATGNWFCRRKYRKSCPESCSPQEYQHRGFTLGHVQREGEGYRPGGLEGHLQPDWHGETEGNHLHR